MHPRLALLFVLLIGLTLVAPAVSAQDARVVMIDVETHTETRVTEEAVLEWRLVSNDPMRTYRILPQIEVADAQDWDVTVEPSEGELAPAEDLRLEVHAKPGARADPRTLEFTLNVLAVNGTDALIRMESQGTVSSLGTVLILGQWENPLPAPLDNTGGAFLLNLAAWLVISLLVTWFIHPVLKAFTRRTKTELDDHIIRILKMPVFLILFAFGVKQSLEVFSLPSWLFHLLDRVWLVALVVALAYIAFRVWHEIILEIGKRLVGRTESQLDDRLLPVFEKIGGVIIVLVGIFYLVSSFGIDLTIFLAGSVIISMVIAFAAQDTLSNFFSGVHLLIDQPFKEGDWIVLDTGELTTVSNIGLRTTHLYHVVNHENIIVPNNLLATHRVINILRPDTKSKVRVDVGVAYGTDVEKVQDLLLDIARNHPLAQTDEEHQPFVRFSNFGDSSLDFSVYFWVKEVLTRWAAASEVRAQIDQRFKEEGIEIPFPQRVLWHGDAQKGEAGGDKSILDHPKVKRDASPKQAGLSEETGAEPGSSGADT